MINNPFIVLEVWGSFILNIPAKILFDEVKKKMGGAFNKKITLSFEV